MPLIKLQQKLVFTRIIVKKKIKPNFKELGKRAGAKMKAIQNAVAAFTADDIASIEREMKYNLQLDGELFELLIADVEILTEDIPGWLVANANGITVALDITLTEALKNEGIARELVNRIQNLRKDSGFEVTDKIKVQLQHNPVLAKAIQENENYIKSETLTEDLVLENEIPNGSEIEFDEIKTRILISK